MEERRHLPVQLLEILIRCFIDHRLLEGVDLFGDLDKVEHLSSGHFVEGVMTLAQRRAEAARSGAGWRPVASKGHLVQA